MARKLEERVAIWAVPDPEGRIEEHRINMSLDLLALRELMTEIKRSYTYSVLVGDVNGAYLANYFYGRFATVLESMGGDGAVLEIALMQESEPGDG